MKRVIIVHGWDGYPETNWFPWLKKELETRGFKVDVPQLPDADSPRIYKWVPALAKTVGMPDEETFFVGHSMGCQAIARYLETLPDDIIVGGAVFVAVFFKKLMNLEEDPDVQETGKHWLTTPIDLTKVRSHLKRSVAIFSDDDPWVPLDNQDDFKNKLGSEIIIEHEKGHFSSGESYQNKIYELPAALESVLKLSS
ncbi:MAG: alpha/beta hydrolase [Candidatus Curtissbacteria bacterium]|nr:alpha/beta hydrolase [Candidatus Curtissbacteria bacterium]